MNQCATYAAFCPNRHHNSPTKCREVIRKYFSVIVGNTVIFICPGCKNLEFNNFRKFENEHRHHLRFLSDDERKQVQMTG